MIPTVNYISITFINISYLDYLINFIYFKIKNLNKINNLIFQKKIFFL